MSSGALTRVAYFDGQRLGADDFRTDQGYFESLGAARNRAVHAAGIASGLDLSLGPRVGSVVVSPGIAVDALGLVLLLDAPAVVEIPAGSASALYVLISAASRPAAASSESGAQGFERAVLTPRVELSVDGVSEGASQVVLGRVLVDARGAVTSIDLRVRVYTAAAVGTATFAFGDHQGDDRPTLQASWVDPAGAVLTVGAARATFLGSLEVAETLGVNVDTPHAQIEVASARDPVVALRTDPKTTAFVLTRAGDVGIGTASPRARLEVAGDVTLDDDASIRFATKPGAVSAIGASGAGPKITFASGALTIAASKEVSLQAGPATAAPTMALYWDGKVGDATIGEIPTPRSATLSVQGRIRTLKGGLLFPDGVLQTTAALSTVVAIGSIIDWWMPADVGLPLPPEFQICDGSVIGSGPLSGNGATVPDLRGIFVRSTTQYGLNGQPTGAATHEHPVPEVPPHTHTIAHTHPDLSTKSGSANDSRDAAKGKEDVLARGGHLHALTVVISQTTTADSGSSSPVTGAATGPADNEPPYFSLMKIMRIR